MAAAIGLAAPGAAAQSTNDAACFIRLANEARAAKGLKQLTVDPTLTSIANSYAQTMVKNNAAVPMNNDELLAQAPAGATLLGQNVGTGTQCDQIHANFLAFQPNDNRLYDPRYDRIGVGVAPSGTTIFVHEVLMAAGPPGSTPASPRPSPSPQPSPTVSPTPTATPTPAPSPTGSPEAPPVVVPEVSPSPPPEATPTGDVTSAEADEGGSKALWVAFGLAVVAAAALGGLVQNRRTKSARR
ncbi:MAG: CAP domain-containing protein [Actinomycetota bacterium]